MKKQIIILMLMAASLTAFASCESESRVDDLKEFVEKVQKEAGTYTEEKWEEVNDEFSKLLDKLNQYEDLSEEELKEMAKLQGEYAATVFKNKGGKVMEEMKKAGKTKKRKVPPGEMFTIHADTRRTGVV